MKRILLIALTIFLPAAATYAQQSAYKYELNKPYRYQAVSTTDVIVDMGPANKTVKAIDSSITKLEFLERNDNGECKMTLTIEYAHMTGDQEAAAEGNKLAAELVGKTIGFRIDRFGDVIEKDTSLLSLSANSASKVIQMVKYLPHIDPEKFAANQPWQWDTSDTLIISGAPMSTQTKAAYSVEGTKEFQNASCKLIANTTSLTMDGEMSNSGVDITMAGSGTTNAVTYFDAGAGIIRKTELSTSSEINLILPEMPDFSGTITVKTQSISVLLAD